MATIRLKAFANADDAHLVWDQDGDIDGCLGFAIQCRRGNKPPKYLSNRVGFKDGATAAAGAGLIARSSQRSWSKASLRSVRAQLVLGNDDAKKAAEDENSDAPGEIEGCGMYGPRPLSRPGRTPA